MQNIRQDKTKDIFNAVVVRSSQEELIKLRRRLKCCANANTNEA